MDHDPVTPPYDEFYYTVAGAAHALGRHPELIRRWIRDRVLTASRGTAHPYPYLIRPSDLIAVDARKRLRPRPKKDRPIRVPMTPGGAA